MCGIAGLVDLKQSKEDNISTLDVMLKTQHHRGPDDTQYWTDDHIFLGHNRLSIIDLTEGGRQPMHLDTYSLVFNGEIYNYKEIREELKKYGHVFRSASDSEVILHAYKQWHEQCVQKFIGMWAFAIWDSKTKTLFASRDRFGIKPFYYIQEGDVFYFASEIKTLKQCRVFSSELNMAQVSRGLQLGWIEYHDETYFTKIKSLPAAGNLILNGASVAITRYWNIETGKYTKLSFEEKRFRFQELFADSIRLHLRSDVPVASCLSGGIDSSSIVSMVQKLNPGLSYKTFSIYYEGKGDVDERPFVQEVINKYPDIEPHYYSPTDEEVRDHFDRALYHADVPATGSSFLSQYFLMKMISENGIRVVLDGQGADEYLGGYMHSFYRLISGMLSRMDLVEALRETINVNRRLGNDIFKTSAHLGKSMLSLFKNEQWLYGFEYRNYYPFLVDTMKDTAPFELKNVPGTRLDQFLYNLVFTTSLPSLLHYEDRNSMAFSIESRVPFLDHRLVEFCFTLTDEDKIRRGETKFILREAMKGIIPDAIYNRKDKKGFVTPGENKWLRGPLKELLEGEGGKDYEFNQIEKKLISDYIKGNSNYSNLIWRLIVFKKWSHLI